MGRRERAAHFLRCHLWVSSPILPSVRFTSLKPWQDGSSTRTFTKRQWPLSTTQRPHSAGDSAPSLPTLPSKFILPPPPIAVTIQPEPAQEFPSASKGSNFNVQTQVSCQFWQEERNAAATLKATRQTRKHTDTGQAIPGTGRRACGKTNS